MTRTKKEEQLDNSEATKRLLILLLISNGVGVQVIADALGVGAATISRMVPQKNLLRKL